MWETLSNSYPIFSFTALPVILIALVKFTSGSSKLIFLGILGWYCWWIIDTDREGVLLMTMFFMGVLNALLPLDLLSHLFGGD